jgi:[ribosomal protein S18]-alanine N-acetyltransferase
MPEVTLRNGTPADIDSLYALDLLCFDKPFRFDLRSMRKYATHPEAIVLVAEEGGELRGFIVVNPTRRKALHSAYVTTLDVHPDFRRLGIAQKLLAEAERRAAGAGAVTMQLHVFTGNTDAIRFYESAGYEQLLLTQDFYSSGLDAFAYTKSLPPL